MENDVAYELKMIRQEFGYLSRSVEDVKKDVIEVKKHLDLQDEANRELREQVVLRKQVVAILKGILIVASACAGAYAWFAQQVKDIVQVVKP